MENPILPDELVMNSLSSLGHRYTTRGQIGPWEIDLQELEARFAQKIRIPPTELRLFTEKTDKDSEEYKLLNQLFRFH